MKDTFYNIPTNVGKKVALLEAFKPVWSTWQPASLNIHQSAPCFWNSPSVMDSLYQACVWVPATNKTSCFSWCQFLIPLEVCHLLDSTLAQTLCKVTTLLCWDTVPHQQCPLRVMSWAECFSTPYPQVRMLESWLPVRIPQHMMVFGR